MDTHQMFHPSSNRLSGFLEVSALFISLAQSGGVQYKAGYLRLETSGYQPGLGRKATSRRDRKRSRWCAVRQSCLIVLEEPGEVCCIFFVSFTHLINVPVNYFGCLPLGFRFQDRTSGALLSQRSPPPSPGTCGQGVSHRRTHARSRDAPGDGSRLYVDDGLDY